MVVLTLAWLWGPLVPLTWKEVLRTFVRYVRYIHTYVCTPYTRPPPPPPPPTRYDIPPPLPKAPVPVHMIPLQLPRRATYIDT